ncbi:hypothetical protein ACIPSA_34120, partial [Streptomyces sp. NPDC086549]
MPEDTTAEPGRLTDGRSVRQGGPGATEVSRGRGTPRTGCLLGRGCAGAEAAGAESAAVGSARRRRRRSVRQIGPGATEVSWGRGTPRTGCLLGRGCAGAEAAGAESAAVGSA